MITTVRRPDGTWASWEHATYVIDERGFLLVLNEFDAQHNVVDHPLSVFSPGRWDEVRRLKDVAGLNPVED